MNLTTLKSGLKTGVKTGLTAAGLAAAAAGLSACVSYASYPPVPKNTAINNPNTPAMEEVMMAGLKWVTAKYPITPYQAGQPSTDRFAISLPPDVKPKVYERVVNAVGGGAEPLTPENESLPIYLVSSIRVRGDQANLWVFRPVLGLGEGPGGKPIYQEVKIWLNGGLTPWHVVSAIDMSPGSGEVPALTYYVPEPPPETRASVTQDQTYKPTSRPAEPAQPIVHAEELPPPAGDTPPEEPPRE